MIQASRIRTLGARPERDGGAYVLYWMQHSQRATFNPALELAIERANALGLPVLVAFALYAVPRGTVRAYAFMLQGLADAGRGLAARGVGFVTRLGDPAQVIGELARDAALVICDHGYLHRPRGQRERLADDLDCEFIEVEGDVVVPVGTASPKHEYAARTLRPKLHRLWEDYLTPLAPRPVRRPWRGATLGGGVDLAQPAAILRRLGLDSAVCPVRRFTGGEGAARARLAAFLDDGLARYADDRSRPEAHAVSELSPYLHFGQISPVEVALAARAAKVASPQRAAFLEELIVRRELAFNHVTYEPAYDRYEGLPGWARLALARAADDPRPHRYDPEALEGSRTHDRYWNAAMREMTATGYMHNRLRMYWGKKILQWSATPQAAFETTLRLNNRWFLDGRDPNSFTNVGWLFGLHDRPWAPQPVFGTVRSMGPNTLKKFDAEAYVADVERIARDEAV